MRIATVPGYWQPVPTNASVIRKMRFLAPTGLESEYGERHVALDTLAAAFASAGQFEEAVKTLNEAIELAPSTLRPDYIARVKLYKAGKPFRTHPAADVVQAVYEASDDE